MLLTEASAAKSAMVFLQGWLGKTHRENSEEWRRIVFPANATERCTFEDRNAAWEVGMSAASNLRVSGAPMSEWQHKLQLLLAPIVGEESAAGGDGDAYSKAWGRDIWDIRKGKREYFPDGPLGDHLYNDAHNLPYGASARRLCPNLKSCGGGLRGRDDAAGPSTSSL